MGWCNALLEHVVLIAVEALETGGNNLFQNLSFVVRRVDFDVFFNKHQGLARVAYHVCIMPLKPSPTRHFGTEGCLYWIQECCPSMAPTPGHFAHCAAAAARTVSRPKKQTPDQRAERGSPDTLSSRVTNEQQLTECQHRAHSVAYE